MVTHNADIAAIWWETHSNSPMGKQYADMIRANGQGYALSRGQLAAVIAKGSAKGKAAGITTAGMITIEDRPKRGRKPKPMA